MKNFIKKYFPSFLFFYSYLRYKIVAVLSVSLAVGLLDSIGLALFLPLLQLSNGDGQLAGKDEGKINYIVDFLENLGLMLTLSNLLILILVFFLFKAIVRYAGHIYQIFLQQELLRKIRVGLLNLLNNLSYQVFSNIDAGRVQNTMTGEVERIQKAYNNYLLTIQQGIFVVVYMVFALFVDLRFALMILVGGSLTNVLYRYIYRRTKLSSKVLTEDTNQYQGQIIQHIGSYKYLKATGLLNVFGERVKNSILKIERSRTKLGFYTAFLENFREPLMILVVVVVISIHINFLNGTLGPILISLLFFYRALTALTLVQNYWNRFIETYGSLDNLISFKKQLRGAKEENGEMVFSGLLEAIDLQHIALTIMDRIILNNLNLRFEKNKTYAIVGESGSGKTSIINVMCALFYPSSGKILFDQIDIKRIDKISLQRRIGYITQDPVIFQDTIYNNVTFWAEPTQENKDQFMKVVKMAALDQLINELPNGFNTKLNIGGLTLSGGQKQRIGIARELFKEIDILIMDEATSALDSETEREIQTNINFLKGKYTIIMVAHRLSTVKDADSIILMDKGEIIGMGSFEDLLVRSAVFRRMTDFQQVNS